MAIPSVAFCLYPAETDWDWRPEDWGANRFISALKNKEFNGYAYVRILGRRLRVNMASAPLAPEWFADLAYNYLLNHKEFEPPFFFVPIPDSSCAINADDQPRMLAVARDLAARFGGRSRACDILRWQRQMRPSHRSGERNVRQLYANLRVVGKIPDFPLVLLDDITTAGGHIRAAEARLREKGGEVELAITAGRTVWEAQDPVWDTFEDEFEIYRP